MALEKSKEEIHSLKIEASKTKVEVVKVEEVEVDLGNLTKSNTRLEAELVELRKGLVEARARNNELTTQVQTLTSQKSSHQLETNQLKSEVARFGKIIDSMKKDGER